MTQVQQMTDQQLNKALAELMGWTEIRGFEGERMWGILPAGDWSDWVPDYCNDPAASLEVQAAAIEANPISYVNNIYESCYGFKRSEDADWDNTNIAFLLNATPRQRAEAAYMTLSQAKEVQGHE